MYAKAMVDTRQITLLIVEDAPFDQKLLAAMVGKLGFNFLLCSDGQEAIILLKERHSIIDLVLLDLNMPVIDGISTLGHCRSHYPHLPVVIITGSEDRDDIEQTQRWGANGFIRKPVELDELKAVIESVLHSIGSNKNQAL